MNSIIDFYKDLSIEEIDKAIDSLNTLRREKIKQYRKEMLQKNQISINFDLQ